MAMQETNVQTLKVYLYLIDALKQGNISNPLFHKII